MDATTNRAPTRSRRLVVAIPLAAVLLAGCAAAGTAAPTPTSTGSTSGSAASGAGVPAVGQVDIAPSGGGTSSASAPNAAIAYPYPVYGGSPGLAPDHELVVGGTGTATMKADGGDRATAQRTALAAAVADAKSQAEAAAHDAGVTLGGVISMSVSVGGGYVGVMPMGASGTPDSVSSSGGTAVPPAAGGTAPSPPTNEQLLVTVTVAYSIS